MALNPLADSRDLRFVLFELLGLDSLMRFPKYNHLDRDMFEEILNLAEKIAIEQIYPVNAESDKSGVKYDPATKKVLVPEALKSALKAYYEAGFAGIVETQEAGGMGLPESVAVACYEIFNAAGMAFNHYPGLARGAMALIDRFGTQKMKEILLPKMLSGEWGGSMCLTEPDAGSDVAALKTKAVRQSDGSYLITGQKIFITCGDNDVYENIIHPVLARIEGDPGGTKGISIFIVPKYRFNDDGSIGEPNDVVCTGIEHKLGIHASPTCSLSFGDNGRCVGYLLGEERKGMKIMFLMMNGARLEVAIQGLALASAAYSHSVTYARNRVQGVHVTQMLNPEARKVPIIQHPDVKRMLLWMKSYVEGMRMLVYFLGYNIDLMHVHDGKERKEAEGLVEVLIPICKAGCTDTSVLATSEAIQVYGGYGYCSDYPVEQYFRDSKITTIYEGTNGIQSMDLVLRKILMNPDHYNYTIWRERVAETIKKAKGIVEDRYVDLMAEGMGMLDEVIAAMKEQMASGKFLEIFASATPLQQAMFVISLAWMHLWSLTLTRPRSNKLVGDAQGEELERILGENAEAAYYYGKTLSSQFFLGTELTKYFGRIRSLRFGQTETIRASEHIFTGTLPE